MAAKGARIAVTANTPVQLTVPKPTDWGGTQSVAILECDVDLYMDGANTVTTSTGAKLASGKSISADFEPGEQWWVVAASSGTVHVWQTGA